MKKICLSLAFICSSLCVAQVGINTTNPEATLDVNGDLIVRTAVIAAPAANYNFLVRNATTNVVERVNGNLGTTSVNNTIAKLKKSSTTGLLDASLYSGYNKINFDAADVKIDNGSLVDVVDDTYTVPTSGVYAVEFQYQYGNGVELQLLSFSGNPNIAILQHNGPSYTVIDSRIFSGQM